MRLQMPDVTLLIYNPAHGPDVSARVLNHCMSMIDFGDVVHMTDKQPDVPCAARFVQVPRRTHQQAQRFQALEIGRHFSTKWVLHVETDGFPVNVDQWSDEFYGYDYIGAPWPDGRVGNGGCSLQSRVFRNCVESLGEHYGGDLSDVWFCKTMRGEIERAGARYAPTDVALRFSFESDVRGYKGWDASRSFGFHGKSPKFAENIAKVTGVDRK